MRPVDASPESDPSRRRTLFLKCVSCPSFFSCVCGGVVVRWCVSCTFCTLRGACVCRSRMCYSALTSGVCDRNALSARNQALADSQTVGTDSEDDGEGAADSRRVSAEDVAIKGRVGLVPFHPLHTLLYFRFFERIVRPHTCSSRASACVCGNRNRRSAAPAKSELTPPQKCGIHSNRPVRTLPASMVGGDNES